MAKPEIRWADAVYTIKQAADHLGISIKTLRGHIRTGRIRYINVGLGEFRPRYRFDQSDLDGFKEANRRRNAEAVIPCRSTSRKTAHTTSSILSGEVIAFSALRSKRANARQSGLKS